MAEPVRRGSRHHLRARVSLVRGPQSHAHVLRGDNGILILILPSAEYARAVRVIEGSSDTPLQRGDLGESDASYR